MSNHGPKPFGALDGPSDRLIQSTEDNSLEQHNGAGLNGRPLTTEPEKLGSIKLSARDLLEKLDSKRLDVSHIKFIGDIVLGKGGSGEVVVATIVSGDSPLELGGKVAVKKFKVGDDIDEERFLRLFVNELVVAAGVSHPNIVKIVGFVEDIGNRIAWLVFPWEVNGNVREFLLSGEWEISERVSLIKDVTSGLEHLHSCQPPIFHGDLKSLNILVNSDHRAMITDFGSSRTLRKARELDTDASKEESVRANQDTPTPEACPEIIVLISNNEITLTGPKLSLRWAAPEVLIEEQFGLAGDIWALGWICWEIITDTYPFSESENKRAITVKVATGSLPLIYTQDQLSQIHPLCNLIKQCWKRKPEERPSATECRSTLEWIPSIVPKTRSDERNKIRSAALLLQNGEIHRLQNRNDEALRMFEEGLAIARATGDSQATARALFLSGIIHQARFNYAEAAECFNEASEIYARIGHDLGRANTLHGLGHLQRMQSKYAEAEESYSEALSLYTSIGGDLGRANALHGLGEIHQERSTYLEGEKCYIQALAIYTRIKNDLGQAYTLYGLGNIHLKQSNYTEAERSYAEALTIYTNIGSDLGRANVSDRLGKIYVQQSKYAEAEKMYSQALDMYTSIKNNLGRANAMDRLGSIYLKQSKYPEAEESCSKALEIYTSVGNDLGRANSLRGMGETRLRQGRYIEAKLFLDDATQTADRIQYQCGVTRAKELLAQILETENLSAEPLLSPMASLTLITHDASVLPDPPTSSNQGILDSHLLNRI